jgi:hypothetical protein
VKACFVIHPHPKIVGEEVDGTWCARIVDDLFEDALVIICPPDGVDGPCCNERTGYQNGEADVRLVKHWLSRFSRKLTYGGQSRT